MNEKPTVECVYCMDEDPGCMHCAQRRMCQPRDPAWSELNPKKHALLVKGIFIYVHRHETLKGEPWVLTCAPLGLSGYALLGDTLDEKKQFALKQCLNVAADRIEQFGSFIGIGVQTYIKHVQDCVSEFLEEPRKWDIIQKPIPLDFYDQEERIEPDRSGRTSKSGLKPEDEGEPK